MTAAQAGLPALSSSGQTITILRHGEPVSVLIPYERMQSILETMEVLANPDAMEVIRDYQAGRLKGKGVTLKKFEKELDALESRR